ncbi:MAG TPA: DMT family transporter [Acidimicrobiales bacterium]|nr:DMT family transporter [Acidimicrobiales bacterium]
MVYVLALTSALANALTSIFQRMGVEDAPEGDTLKLRLLTNALRRGIWLLGFALMIASFLIQAVALHFGRMAEVQPILTTELLWLVLILGTWFRFKVGWREWVASLLASLGLAGFLFFANPTGDTGTPSGQTWFLTGMACAAATAVAVLLALRGPRWWRAAMFGAAGAIGFAFTAALTKSVTDYIAKDWVSMFAHWQLYALVFCGVASVFLAQNAYHAGPIAASQAALVLVDPLVSILIGVALFEEHLRTGFPWGPLEALSLLIMFTGAFVLATSPLVSGVKGEEGPASENLSIRARSRRVVDLPAPGKNLAPESPARSPLDGAPLSPPG